MAPANGVGQHKGDEMTAKSTLVDKATAYARDVSENANVFVYEQDGVYWLAVRRHDTEDCRTMQAVGTNKTGIRFIKQQIAEYFQGK